MSFINSFICPKCNEPFPLFIKPSIRIYKGPFVHYLKCQNCGQISQKKIDVLSAAWIWPLTIGLFISVIYELRSFLYLESPFLYFLIVGIPLVLFFIGIRRGLKLVPVEKKRISQSLLNKWVIPSVVITLCSLILLVYYTHDWINVVLGISIGLIVWIFIYYLSRRRSDKRSSC